MTVARSFAIEVLICAVFLGACASPPHTPLTAAVRNGDIERVRRHLEDHADPDERGYAGWTPLYLAVMHDHNEIAKLLLAAGADVNRRSVAWFYDADGSLPLELAARRGNTEMVQLLLEHGAKVDARDFQARPTALMSAAQSGPPELVELLIAHGADVNARNREGRTPLHHAAGGRKSLNEWSRENARILIERGADLEAMDDYGGRPLHEASCTGNVPVLLLLLDHGARTDARNETGVSALGFSAMCDELLAAHVLLPFYRDDRQALDEAIAQAKKYGHDVAAHYLTQVAASRRTP